MRALLVPFEARSFDGPGQDSLAYGDSTQRGRVETAERVEGVAFYLRAPDRGVDKIQIKKLIVPDKYRPVAAVRAKRPPYFAKNALQSFLLR